MSLNFSIRGILNGLFKLVVLVILIIVANLASSFLLGILLSFSGNIQAVGLNSISFDPLITIAYILLFYFMTMFYQPRTELQYYLFLLTLFLSFTVNFIQGSLFLIVLYFLLRKTNQI